MVFPGSRRRSRDLLSLRRVRMESREWDMGAFGIREFLGYGSRVSLGISTPSSPAWNSSGIPLELCPSRAVPHCGICVSMECWAPFSLCHGFGKELENPRRLLPSLGSSRGFFLGRSSPAIPGIPAGAAPGGLGCPLEMGNALLGASRGSFPVFSRRPRRGQQSPRIGKELGMLEQEKGEPGPILGAGICTGNSWNG